MFPDLGKVGSRTHWCSPSEENASKKEWSVALDAVGGSGSQLIEGRLKSPSSMQKSLMRLRTELFETVEYDGGRYTRRQYTLYAVRCNDSVFGRGLQGESVIMCSAMYKHTPCLAMLPAVSFLRRPEIVTKESAILGNSQQVGLSNTNYIPSVYGCSVV